MKNSLIIIFISFTVLNSGISQGFFKKLTDRATDKIARKAEDKLIEELSEKIANEAVKPINSFVDSLFVSSYENETGEKYDPDNSAKMTEALSAMFGEVDLPESYEFDFTIDVELKDYGSKKSEKMKMFVCKDQPIFGIEKNEDKSNKAMIIFDSENQAMVTYDLNKMECMAIAINSKLLSFYGEAALKEEMEKQNLTVEKTGKTKKIIGYKSDQYIYNTTEAESDVYISQEVPFNWDDSFGKMMMQFAPNFYKNNEEYKMNGMMLQAVSKRKSDGKKSEWKTKKLKEKKVTIDNSDYEKKSIGSYSDN